MKYIYTDSEFGEITITQRQLARRCIFRVKTGNLEMTYPPKKIHPDDIKRIIDENRDGLRKLIGKQKNKLLKAGEIISTRDFLIVIEIGNNKEMFCFRHEPGTLYIYCPPETDFEQPQVQEILRKGIRNRLKIAAEKHLPQRAKALAEKTKNQPRSIAITHGRQRLGRCDSRGNILLSYYLMLLPDRLIDYVILHEFSHLHEMNHGAKFYALCNKYCEGNLEKLKKELKKFPFPID